MTSHDVVAQVRKIAGTKYVGHGGTLDPMAEGVLPIALGSACRLLRFLPDTKVYRAQILLGRSTTTDDIEGETISQSDDLPNMDEVKRLLTNFVGEIEQVPPNFSAIKHKGERLYDLARQGQTVAVAPRPITIHNIEILRSNLPLVDLRISCSAGTYIRSIARDLGSRLGIGGCLNALLREKAGVFALDSSVKLEKLFGFAQEKKLAEVIQDPVAVFRSTDSLPCLNVDNVIAGKLRLGQKLPMPDNGNLELGANYLAVTSEDLLVAICTLDSDGILHPEVVIADACKSA